MESSHIHEKSYLLDAIKLAKISLGIVIKNNQEYDHYLKKPLNFNWLAHIIVFFIFLIITLFLYASLSVIVFNSDEINDLTAPLLFCVSIVLYVFIYVKINKTGLKSKLEKNKGKMEKIIEDNKKEMVFLEGLIIPKQYLTFHALNNFENYIETGRADTLKEAMNLYEQEIRHEQNINEIRLLQALQEKTYQSANEAATLSWINLFLRK